MSPHGAAAIATGPAAGLAPDPALPRRDALLDADGMGEHLALLLGTSGPLDVRSCRLVRAKYRLGESLRAVYALELPDGEQLVTGRAFATAEAAASGARAAARRVPVAPTGAGVRAVAADPDHGAVWWTFPNDRKLDALERLVRPDGALAALPAGRWVASAVMEYAPERSATVRALGPDGATLGYAKAYGRGGHAARSIALHRHVAAVLAARTSAVRSPVAIADDEPAGLVVLEAMPGRRWDELDAGEARRLLALLGTGVAHLHDEPVPGAADPFERLRADRLATAAALVAEARPDVADAASRLARRLAGGPPGRGESVLLHGDLHPKNALLHGDALSLIDLDQAGVGDPAAELGGLLARLRCAELTGDVDAAGRRAATGATLDAYARVRPLPTPERLGWYTAAALLAERALRSVNRVQPRSLAVLPAMLDEALRLAHGTEIP